MERKRMGVVVLLMWLLVLTTKNSAAQGTVVCCPPSTESSDSGASADGDCRVLSYDTPIVLTLHWNGGAVDRVFYVDLCWLHAWSSPLPSRRCTPGPMSNPVAPQSYIAQYDDLGRLEGAFDHVLVAPSRSSSDTITAILRQTNEPQLNATVVMRCGSNSGGAVHVRGNLRPLEYLLDISHPSACAPERDVVSVSFGDFVLGILILSLIILALYHISVNAFVKERRGCGLLEPLPTWWAQLWALLGHSPQRHSLERAGHDDESVVDTSSSGRVPLTSQSPREEEEEERPK